MPTAINGLHGKSLHKKIHGLHPAGPVYIDLLLKGISDTTIGHVQVPSIVLSSLIHLLTVQHST